MARFWMAPHVYACATAGGVILLDLKRDRYLGFSVEQSRALGREIVDWPLRGEAAETFATDPNSYSGLLAQGLLTAEMPPNPRLLAAAANLGADLISVGDEIDTTSRVRARDVGNFVGDLALSVWSLKCRALINIVEQLRREKLKAYLGSARLPGDLAHLAQLVARFRHLRALTFSAEGHCLLHALTLVRFLSHYGWKVDWVIGVATHPWGAHAWVQWNQYLLDSNPEKVCRYTPILVV